MTYICLFEVSKYCRIFSCLYFQRSDWGEEVETSPLGGYGISRSNSDIFKFIHFFPAKMSELDIPTPLWGKLDESVYEPAEDSFLLMDAFIKDKSYILQLNPSIIVEIGVGSGVITSFIRSLITSNANPSSRSFINFGTDLNPFALKATSETAKLNKQPSPELINCDLLTPFLHRWKGLIDILIFNPPYVPTDHEPTNHLVSFTSYFSILFIKLFQF